MPTMKTLLPLLGAVAVAAQVQNEGCYSSSGSLQNHGKNIYQSTGACFTSCDKTVIGLTGSECYCGDEVPPFSDKVEDSKCSTPCPGYPYDKCGGDGYWSISTIGGSDVPGNTTSESTTAPATSSSSSSSVASTSSMNATTTSSAPSTSTSAEYTGAAAQPAMGAGVVAIGALFALL
ncbi:uncharacterized protein RCC_01797 [Ramularia collo-cygni]|uniref:WSC domain-containing protein n=1 Tax=Ramularia collo-cygni TaxID=112498 RepID=A0A2D3UV65_9PEZI|nr:uncharacterized protein RCC_01797 [Ramularia collo-cygni]CZT15957.1 uncharacterized protein RCC_01797 [Ramularia collo-cygni]